MSFDFNAPIDCRNTNTSKWDSMEKFYGVSPDTGIPMWTASMDLRAPPAVNATLRRMADHGAHGYFGAPEAYEQAIIGWMAKRHNWHVERKWILSTPGLVTAIGMTLQAFSEPGDGIIIFTPVYHEFHSIIKANDRRIVQSELINNDGRYEMDLNALAASLDGSEKMVIFCSPQNPSGRIWSVEELRALADFCAAHDLILVADEVHHDLVYPGHAHTVMANAAPDIADRLVMLTAASKTFNIAGARLGQVIVSDPILRERMRKVLKAANLNASRVGAMMVTAAYAYGEDWLEALIPHLDFNRQMFDERINALPGIRSMPLEATYLAWVDFSGTGMDPSEVIRRIEKTAQIAASHGEQFGKGGEHFMRFNFAATRSVVADAIERLENAFADLQ